MEQEENARNGKGGVTDIDNERGGRNYSNYSII
jgi:hypothetical protein